MVLFLLTRQECQEMYPRDNKEGVWVSKGNWGSSPPLFVFATEVTPEMTLLNLVPLGLSMGNAS